MTPSTTCWPTTPTSEDKPEVVGDSAYADGETRDRLGNAGYTVRAKVPPARNRAGRFTKDQFHINLDDDTVTCPAEQTVTITPVTARRRQGQLRRTAARCPLRKPLHRRPPGTLDQHPPSRSDPADRPHRTAHPRMGRALPSRPSDRRTQDRPLRPPAVGWPQGPMSRPRPHRHRRRHPRRRHQPGAPRRPRRRLRRHHLGGRRHQLTSTPSRLADTSAIVTEMVATRPNR